MTRAVVHITLASALTVLALSALPAAAAAADTPEFPAQTEAIVEATSALFDAVEGVTPQAQQARPRVTIGPLLTPASFKLPQGKAAVLSEHGAVRHLTGYRITWYPMDRFLGAVDFMGTWDGNKNLVCGYVMWDLTDPKSPVLDRISANYVDLAALTDASPQVAEEKLLDANCAYGAVDANYTVFDPGN